MPAITTEYDVQLAHQRRPWFARLRRHWRILIAAAFILAFAIYVVVLACKWPFRERSVLDVLHKATLRTVKIGSFRKTFFPPGCVLQAVQFEHHLHTGKRPIIYIDTLTLEGSYWSLLTAQYRLSLIKASKMHVLVPPAEVHGQPDPLMPLNSIDPSLIRLRIDKIVADGAIVDFAQDDGASPYRITVQKMAVLNVSNNSAVAYNAVLTTSVPPGEMRASGVFGPWRPSHPAETQVHGTYEYQDVNLGAFKAIEGTMQAKGRFAGSLGEIRTNGTANVRNFHVSDTSHYRDLVATFDARVDGIKGQAMLDNVSARFDHSSLTMKGAIGVQEGSSGQAISLDVACGSGRVEDILFLFIEAKRSPLLGALKMSAHISVPPGQTDFLTRMRMWGDFGVENGRFTNTETQGDLNRLSESAEKKQSSPHGEQPALSVLKGHGDVRHGVANLTDLAFSVPGAVATMNGTYSLVGKYDINLHGTLYTDGKPWVATTGFKSWMVRIITPFLKKKNDIRVVPFKITGTYAEPNIGLDLWSKQDRER